MTLTAIKSGSEYSSATIISETGAVLAHVTPELYKPDIQNQRAKLFAASEELLEALTWALGVIEICETNAHNVDWSIGHFGRKARAQAAINKVKGE